MTKLFSAMRLPLATIGALMILVGVVNVKAAHADFIGGINKQLDCPLGGLECGFQVTQQFVIDPINSFTVIKDIIVQPQPEPLFVFHVGAGLWEEKDLKHLGFLCLDASCDAITGFGGDVRFENPLFDIDIPDLHGLSTVGQRIPDVKFVSPLEAIAWLPDRPIFQEFFFNRDVLDQGLVPVLFTHIPEPSTLYLFGLGILGLAWLTRRRRTAQDRT